MGYWTRILNSKGRRQKEVVLGGTHHNEESRLRIQLTMGLPADLFTTQFCGTYHTKLPFLNVSPT